MDLYLKWSHAIYAFFLQIISVHKRAFLQTVFISILFLVGCLYYQGVHGPFLLDDIQNLSDATLNPFSWQEWLRVSLANSAGPFGRPLSIASFALNEYWLGPDAFGYKIVNIAIHLLIGVLIYQVILSLLTQLKTAHSKAIGIAGITTLIWLIHPLQVSTVLYAVQRMAQLSTLFLVLGLLFYVKGYNKLSFLCWPLAIFSKETGILLPFYLLAIEYFIYYSQNQNAQKLKYLLVWSGLTALGGIFYYFAHYETYYLAFANKGYTLGQQLLTQIQILGFYLHIILLPQLNHLSLFHDDFPIVTQLSPSLIFSILNLLFFIAIIFIAKKKHPILAFGIVFFLISHLIESTVLPLELVFEHRNYLAILGPVFIISYYAAYYNRFLMLAPFVMILSFLTFTRIHCWSQSELFLTLELLDHPRSPRAHIEWANFLLEQNKMVPAKKHLKLAHELAPQDAGIRLHELLIQCESLTPLDKTAYQNAAYDVSHLSITPYCVLVFNNLVQKAFNQTCPALSSSQIFELLNLAIANPRVQFQKNYLATLFHLRAGIYAVHHDILAAIQDLEKAYELYPRRLEPLVEKVRLQIMLNQYKMAEQSLERVTQLAQKQWVKDRSALTKLKTEIDNNIKQPLV